MVLPKPLSKVTPPTETLVETPGTVVSIIQALRVHQWIKNVLVFVPLLMAHKILDINELKLALYGFVAWCCCASGVYLLNDLFDLETDRSHPRKKQRPIASGRVSPMLAWILMLLLIGTGMAVASIFLPRAFAITLLLYVGLTTAYTIGVKQLLIIDVLMLAGFYTLRVISGGFATSIYVSPWLLGFSMFLFLNLAFVKRYTELSHSASENRIGVSRRGYTTTDMEFLKTIGPASGYLSVLVLALYINSREVTALYHKPTVLWLIGPLLFYWITRIWLLAHRGQMDEDPIVFTIKDPTSYVVGALTVIVIVVATLW